MFKTNFCQWQFFLQVLFKSILFLTKIAYLLKKEACVKSAFILFYKIMFL